MLATIRVTSRVTAVLAAAALAATACSDGGAGPRPTHAPTTSTTRPAKPAPPDQNLRDVSKAMIYNDGIAHVMSETSAQMICGALSPAEWSEALGSRVGRAVYGGVDASCVVDTGILAVTLQTMVEQLGAEGERIHGRRVKFATSTSERVASAFAAIVPAGEQDIPTQQRIGADPVLHLQATMNDRNQPAPDLPALLRRLLTALLPRLTPPGPTTPVYNADRKLIYTPTDRPADVPIYDLPQTVQSLVLCTIILRETGIKAQPSAGIFVNSVSECDIRKPRIFAKVDRFLDPAPESSPVQIAGRPAQERPDIGMVINLLTMRRESGRAEHLTLRLNNYTGSEQLRAWAEKIAQPLLAN